MSKGRVPWPSSISSCESPLRKKGNHFKGKADHQTKPSNRTSEDVLNGQGCESSIWKGTWQRTCSEQRRRSRTHVEEEVYILGATLVQVPMGKLWELNYAPTFKVPLFKCQWVKAIGGGVAVDN